MKYPETSKRLKEAMNDANINQRELAEKAGIKEASVSQYINGSHSPSNKSSARLSEVLGVSPVWLMGFDVPKYDDGSQIDLSALTDENKARLFSYYKFLIKDQEEK